MSLEHYIETLAANSASEWQLWEGTELTLDDDRPAGLVVVHRSRQSDRTIRLGRNASLRLVELFEEGAVGRTAIRQEEGSRIKLTSLLLGEADAAYTVDLCGSNAASEIDAVFALGGEEQSRLAIRTNHLVADCTSQSVVRGLAGGRAVGRFEGMVYVAPDAQRTDARQQNRNMLLSDTARIDTMPQLEIYADDVKCTHGATVGQMDQEAIYYMRQRGISEQQARRLQLAGFTADLVMQCGCEELCAELLERLNRKLDTM